MSHIKFTKLDKNHNKCINKLITFVLRFIKMYRAFKKKRNIFNIITKLDIKCLRLFLRENVVLGSNKNSILAFGAQFEHTNIKIIITITSELLPFLHSWRRCKR